MYAVMIIHDDGKRYVQAIVTDVYAAEFIARAFNENNAVMQNPVTYSVESLENK